MSEESQQLVPSGATSSESSPEPSKELPRSVEVSIDGLFPTMFSVTWNVTGTGHQHLLTFPALRLSKDAPPALPAGSCNLYQHPSVVPNDPNEATAIVAEDAVAVLDKLVIALFTTTDLLDGVDGVGAFPDHALNVSNTTESLRLMQQVYALRPALLQRVHLPGRRFADDGKLFTYESSLHIFTVNKRESECIKSLKIATERLSRNEVTEMLRHQCTGAFFQDKPMCDYGGHAMAFAAGFGQIDVCAACVALGHREWKDWRCELTGYLPVHVATVRNQGEMVDWLVAHFGIAQLSAEAAGFTPLLLATRLGHQDLVRRLLKHDHEVLWVWGNITQWRLRLQSTLDSHASKGATTVIELLGRYDSSERRR